MRYEIIGKPYYPVLRVVIEIGDRFISKMDYVISFDTNTKWKDADHGLYLFYVDVYPSEMIFASKKLGDIYLIELSGQSLYVRSDSIFAFYGDVSIDREWGGSKDFFEDQNISLFKITGKGGVFVAPAGMIYKKWIEGTNFISEENVIAFEPSLSFKPYSISEDQRSFYAFNGGGNMYIQTRK
ncbi:AIM24 family protein [Athalassotoga sp.]|uniref:AIM24 family protein n=1 Tax=Athalassotoga sp. TaxID=2022597 RepID=UPI003D02354D